MNRQYGQINLLLASYLVKTRFGCPRAEPPAASEPLVGRVVLKSGSVHALRCTPIGYKPSRTITESVGEFIEWYEQKREWYEPLVRKS